MPEFTLPEPLLQAIRRCLSAGQPLTLAIDGCSAAGKTTLARRLQQFFHRWIPLEQLYFQQLRPDARCDLILEDPV